MPRDADLKRRTEETIQEMRRQREAIEADLQRGTLYQSDRDATSPGMSQVVDPPVPAPQPAFRPNRQVSDTTPFEQAASEARERNAVQTYERFSFQDPSRQEGSNWPTKGTNQSRPGDLPTQTPIPAEKVQGSLSEEQDVKKLHAKALLARAQRQEGMGGFVRPGADEGPAPGQFRLRKDQKREIAAKVVGKFISEKTGMGGLGAGAEMAMRYLPAPMDFTDDAPSMAEQAKALGIEPYSNIVGADVRFRIAQANGFMGTSPEKETAIAEWAVERSLGRNMDVKYDPRLQAVVVREVGEADPDKGWMLLNSQSWDPHAVIADLAGYAPDAITIGADVVGTVFGAVGGSGVKPGTGTAIGAVAGGAVAQGLAEFARLKGAQQMGAPLSDEEIWWQAKIAAGVSAGSGAVAQMITGMMARSVKGIYGYDVDIVKAAGGEEAVEAGAARGAALSAEAEAATGQPMRTTVGQQAGLEQALAERAPATGFKYTSDAAELLAAESTLRESGRRSYGQGLQDIVDEQSAVKDAIDFSTFLVKDPDAIAATRSKGANALWQAVKGRMRSQHGYLTDLANKARTALGRGERALGAKAGDPAQGERQAAGSLRGALMAAQDTTFDSMRPQYRALEEATGLKLSLVGPRDAYDELARRFPERVAAIPESVRQVLENPRPGLDEVQDALKALRFAERSRAVQDTPASMDAIRTLENAITVARDEALERASPVLRDHVKALEAAYASASEQFERGIIGEMLSEHKGVWRLQSQELLDWVTKSPDNAWEFVNMLNRRAVVPPQGSRTIGGRPLEGTRPSFQGTSYTMSMPYAHSVMQATREGIFKRLRAQFYDHDAKAWDVKGVNKWYDERREALRTLGIGAEIKNVKGLMATADRQARRLERFADATEKRWGYLRTTSPDVLIQKLMKDGKAHELPHLLRIVQREFPEDMWKVESALRAEARDQMTDKGGKITADSISAFIESPTGQVVGKALGGDFMPNLRIMRNIFRATEQRPAPGTGGPLVEQSKGLLQQGQDLYRRYARVIFPPFSTKGRGLTATVATVDAVHKKRIADILADPEKLRKMVKLYKGHINPYNVAHRQILGELGLDYVVNFWDHAKAQGVTPENIEDGEEPL